MDKNRLLKIINSVLAILVISQGATGLGHDYIPHKVFELIHPRVGRLLLLFVILHLALN